MKSIIAFREEPVKVVVATVAEVASIDLDHAPPPALIVAPNHPVGTPGVTIIIAVVITSMAVAGTADPRLGPDLATGGVLAAPIPAVVEAEKEDIIIGDKLIPKLHAPLICSQDAARLLKIKNVHLISFFDQLQFLDDKVYQSGADLSWRWGVDQTEFFLDYISNRAIIESSPILLP